MRNHSLDPPTPRERFAAMLDVFATPGVGGNCWDIERDGAHFRVELSRLPVFLISTTIHKANRDARRPYRDGESGDVLERLPRVRFLPETLADRWAQKLRLAADRHSGDAAFDAAVWVESGAPEVLVTALVARPSLRSAVLAIFEHGAKMVALNHDEYQVVVYWRPEDVPPTRQWVDDAVAKTHALREALPDFADVELIPAWRPGPGFHWGLGVSAALVLGAMLYMYGHDLYQPLALPSWGFVLALATYLALVLRCFASVRGTPRPVRALAGTALVGLAAVPLCVLGGMIWLNGLLGESPQMVSVELRARGRDISGNYIVVAPLPPYQHDLKLYSGDGVIVGPIRSVWIGDGALGMRWFGGVVESE